MPPKTTLIILSQALYHIIIVHTYTETRTTHTHTLFQSKPPYNTLTNKQNKNIHIAYKLIYIRVK